MLTWGEFVKVQPDLARVGHRLLRAFDVGLGFLATTRPDGGPRVHPICPLLTEDGLFAFVVPGPKLSDLRRDRRYALHCETFPPPQQDDAFYVTGSARERPEGELRKRLADQFVAERDWLDEAPPELDEQPVIEFLIERCLLTLTEPDGALPAGHTIWHA